MDFNNVRVLGYSHSSNFFGDDLFRFRSDKNLSIQGTIVDLTGANKVSSGIWNEMTLLSQFSDYEPVVINGVTFGSGRMDTLTFEGGQDIDVKNYTADLTIFSTGNLFNLTGEFYTGIDVNDYRYVNDLAEDFTFNFDGSERTYTQKIAVNCYSGNGIDPLGLAKGIASNLFSVNAITGLIGDYDQVNTNPRYSETIDLINNTYQVEKTITIGNESGDYSATRTHSFSLNEDGYYTIEEKGEIKGLKTEDPWNAALTGANYEIQTSYSRCAQIYGVYKMAVAPEDEISLNSKIISLSKTLNSFDDTISYSVLYGNSKVNDGDGASNEETVEVTRDNLGTYDINIRGTVNGWGLNNIQQFEAAKTLFTNNVKPSFGTTVRLALLRHRSVFLPWKLQTSSVSYNQFNGSISYNYTYTTNYSYKTGTFKKEEINVSDNLKNNIINRYGIFNQKEIIQKANISSISSRSLSLTLIGRRGVSLDAYLNRARDIVNSYLPIAADILTDRLKAEDIFLQDLNYSFSPKTYTFSLDLVWPYTSLTVPDKTNLRNDAEEES